MIGPIAMSDEVKVSATLSSAIAELRAELLHWIDSELARLRERERADERSLARAIEPEFGGSSGRRGAKSAGIDFQSGTAGLVSRIRERDTGRDRVDEPVRKSVAVPEGQADPNVPTPLANSRERLDTLARLLDDRLKQTQAAAESSAGRAMGPITGVRDEGPSPSTLERPR